MTDDDDDRPRYLAPPPDEPVERSVSLLEELPDRGFASEPVELSPLVPLTFSFSVRDAEPEPSEPAPSEPAPPSPEPDPDPPSPDADAAFAAEREAELRSFLAQPLPLKWMLGAENDLRTGAAPQIGQLVGPSAVTDWRTSKRWPFGQR